jgi:hypothetical protein
MRHAKAVISLFDAGSVATLEPNDLEALDAAVRARLLPAFLGVKTSSRLLRYVPRSTDGMAPAWVFDEDSGMVYILD